MSTTGGRETAPLTPSAPRINPCTRCGTPQEECRDHQAKTSRPCCAGCAISDTHPSSATVDEGMRPGSLSGTGNAPGGKGAPVPDTTPSQVIIEIRWLMDNSDGVVGLRSLYFPFWKRAEKGGN